MFSDISVYSFLYNMSVYHHRHVVHEEIAYRKFVTCQGHIAKSKNLAILLPM